MDISTVSCPKCDSRLKWNGEATILGLFVRLNLRCTNVSCIYHAVDMHYICGIDEYYHYRDRLNKEGYNSNDWLRNDKTPNIAKKQDVKQEDMSDTEVMIFLQHGKQYTIIFSDCNTMKVFDENNKLLLKRTNISGDELKKIKNNIRRYGLKKFNRNDGFGITI